MDTVTLAAADGRRFERAIAARNTAWANYRAAEAMLRSAEAAGQPEELLRPLRRNYNRAQDEWQTSIYHLTRERRRFQLCRGVQ